MLELILKYPRVITFIFSFVMSIIAAATVCCPMGYARHLAIYISSAIICGTFWTTLVAKRIADKTESCTYFRAALLGALATFLALSTIGIPVNIQMRWQQVIEGILTSQQAIRSIFIDDISSVLGCNLFVLLCFGWYLIPLGGLAGMILRWLRGFYDPTPSA